MRNLSFFIYFEPREATTAEVEGKLFRRRLVVIFRKHFLIQFYSIMKRLLFALAAILCLSTFAKAQKAEFQIGYGGYTQMDATDMADDANKNNAWGALTAGVNFKVAPSFKLGASYTFSSTSFRHYKGTHIFYHVVMLNGYYDYWNNSIVKLYAHVGLGVDFTHIGVDGYDDNKSYFAYQFVPLGAQVDLSRSAAIFGEVGFGAQGLLAVGARFKF